MTRKDMGRFARGNTVAGGSTGDLANRRYKARVRFILPMIGVVLSLSQTRTTSVGVLGGL